MNISRSVSLVFALALSTAVLGASTRAGAATFTDLTSWLAATSDARLVNFDVTPGGDPTPGSGDIGSTYSALGVTFSPGNFYGSPIGPVSSPYGWFNNTLVGNDRVFDATFIVSGITSVGVQNVLYSAKPNGAILRAYDASDNLLGSVSSDSDGGTLDFFGLTTSSDIARITVTVVDPYGWGLDDLRFGRADDGTVPEPGSLAMLLGAGIVGTGVIVRRRRA